MDIIIHTDLIDSHQKKKSPSDLRRDAKRLEKFLDSKKKTSIPIPESNLGNPLKSAESPNLSSVGATPINVDSHVSETEAMDTRDNASETLNKTYPRNDVKDDSPPLVDKIPSQISPVNSPQKRKNQPSTEVENKSVQPENIPPTEEIRVKLCATNKKTAMFHTALTFMGEPTKNHFVFSVNFPQSQIKKVKKDLYKAMKPPDGVHIVDYYVFNEDKIYHPAEKKHCPGCDKFKS